MPAGQAPEREAGAVAWIFGYGSLVWRPDFAYLERCPGFVRGWARRFWQGSTDHRGVPGAPGRVVTLIPSADATCWGMAYALDPEQVPRTVRALDFRERGGYARHDVAIHLAGGGPVSGAVYIATPENANYLGPADTEAIARQISVSAGPSGHNVEYLLRLAESIRRMEASDPHVFELEHRVRSLTRPSDGETREILA